MVSYASSKCEEFSDVVPELDEDGVGLQAPHEEGVSEIAVTYSILLH